MILCKECGKALYYNSYFKSYICTSCGWTKRINLTDANNIIIEKDGNEWCAHRKDCNNIQESLVGFGKTEIEALTALIQEEQLKGE